MADIHVDGWTEPPGDEDVRALIGAVISTMVPIELVSGRPIPFFEMFRFARVLSVDAVSPHPDVAPCSRCENPARYRLVVEWEAGYASPDGNVLCEHCVEGVVSVGADLIPFGADDAPADLTINLTHLLRPKKTTE
jgi:hypothetical protein